MFYDKQSTKNQKKVVKTRVIKKLKTSIKPTPVDTFKNAMDIDVKKVIEKGEVKAVEKFMKHNVSKFGQWAYWSRALKNIEMFSEFIKVNNGKMKDVPGDIVNHFFEDISKYVITGALAEGYTENKALLKEVLKHYKIEYKNPEYKDIVNGKIVTDNDLVFYLKLYYVETFVKLKMVKQLNAIDFGIVSKMRGWIKQMAIHHGWKNDLINMLIVS